VIDNRTFMDALKSVAPSHWYSFMRDDHSIVHIRFTDHQLSLLCLQSNVLFSAFHQQTFSWPTLILLSLFDFSLDTCQKTVSTDRWDVKGNLVSQHNSLKSNRYHALLLAFRN
jgi:hypothetical protein